MNLSDFSLLKEDNESYTVGHPQGKSMVIPKKGLSSRAQELVSKLKREQNFAEGTPDGPVGVNESDEALQKDLAADPRANEDVSLNVPTAQPTPNLVAPNLMNPSQMELGQAQPAQVAPPPAAAEPAQNALTVGLDNTPYKQAKQAIRGGAEAQGKAGDTEAAGYQEAAIENAKSALDFQNRVKAYQAKDDELRDAYANKSIDPDRYWKNLDTGSQISASIGLALSGLGSAITGQPNLAFEHIQRAIDRDVQAQMNEQGKSMNLWKMNREALGNDTQATLATQNQLLGVAKTKAQAAMATAQGPIAKANVANGILAIDTKIQDNNSTRALLDMAQTAPQQGGLSTFDPAPLVDRFIHDEGEKKEALKELGDLKQAVKLKKSMMASYQDLNKKLFAGALSPEDRKSAMNSFAGIIAKLSEGRFNMEESKIQMEAFMPSAGEDQQTRDNKLARLNQFFDGLVKVETLRAKHIPIDKFTSTNLNAANNGRLPGTTISFKSIPGKQFKIGQDGVTLTPL